jgi:hypothetical protein
MVSSSRSNDALPSVWIAWVAFLTLPAMAFGARFAWYSARASAVPSFIDQGFSNGAVVQALSIARWSLVGGLLIAGLVALLAGPHLTLGFGLVLTLAGSCWMTIDPGTLPLWLTAMGTGVTGASVIASAGVSTGGGAPGLRYAAVVAMYAAANAAGGSAPLLVEQAPWAGPIVAGMALCALPVPLLTWWFAKRRPRVPDPGSTARTALVGAGIFVFLLAVQASYVLQEPLWASLPLGWQQSVNPVAVLLTATVVILALLVLQIASLPSRFGVMAGAGALLLSVTCTLSWSMGAGAPALAMLALAGVSEVFVYPWALARATSDVHWRLATLFAAIVMLPPYLLDGTSTVVAVLAAMIVSVLAIPVGGVGWVADSWIFGDEPGPVERRRGHRG